MSMAALRRRRVVLAGNGGDAGGGEDPGGGGDGESILLATFSATDHSETGGNLDRWDQNGVIGYNRAWVQRAEFAGGSPSGTHAYKMRWWDSIAGSGGNTDARAEFGVIFPADYGDDLRIEWDQYIPDGENGPALNLTPGDGFRQFKLLRAWPLLAGETMSDDGYESYGCTGKMGFSEYCIGDPSGVQTVFNYRVYADGAPSSWDLGPEPWFAPTQHPPAGERDGFYASAANRGAWKNLRARLKIQSTEVTDDVAPGDGIAQLWRDGVLMNGSGTDFRNYPGAGQSRDWRYAYIVGARDTNTYTGECVWIDNIKIYKGGFP